MKQPNKILVPVDLSERSEVGMAYAAMMAETTGAELVVMTNMHVPERETLEALAAADHVSTARATDTVQKAVEAAIQRLILAYAPGATTSAVVRYQASPAEAILETASSEAVDLIVLASHGRSGMTRWMLGSVAEKIARGAEVPVLIVPVRDEATASPNSPT